MMRLQWLLLLTIVPALTVTGVGGPAYFHAWQSLCLVTPSMPDLLMMID